jgi:hypothetical protein
MPDLKSELMKLNNLKFDDEGEPDMPVTMAEPTATEQQPPSMREQVWNHIKANPMTSNAGLSAALGLSCMTSASHIGALFNRSLVTRVQISGAYHYTAVGDSYPVSNRADLGKKISEALRKKRMAERTAKEAIAKEQVRLLERAVVKEAQAKVPVSLAAFSAQDMIESMPIGKARALYVELKKLFGN